MTLYRHGDLSFHPIEKLPENLKKINNPILAYGEATGHNHLLVAERENQFEIMEDLAGNRYLQVNEPTRLTHQEHKEITIEKGLYWVRNEREYNYFENATKRVVD
jgi:hypothetical protein